MAMDECSSSTRSSLPRARPPGSVSRSTSCPRLLTTHSEIFQGRKRRSSSCSGTVRNLASAAAAAAATHCDCDAHVAVPRNCCRAHNPVNPRSTLAHTNPCSHSQAQITALPYSTHHTSIDRGALAQHKSSSASPLARKPSSLDNSFRRSFSVPILPSLVGEDPSTLHIDQKSERELSTDSSSRPTLATTSSRAREVPFAFTKSALSQGSRAQNVLQRSASVPTLANYGTTAEDAEKKIASQDGSCSARSSSFSLPIRGSYATSIPNSGMTGDEPHQVLLPATTTTATPTVQSPVPATTTPAVQSPSLAPPPPTTATPAVQSPPPTTATPPGHPPSPIASSMPHITIDVNATSTPDNGGGRPAPESPHKCLSPYLTRREADNAAAIESTLREHVDRDCARTILDFVGPVNLLNVRHERVKYHLAIFAFTLVGIVAHSLVGFACHSLPDNQTVLKVTVMIPAIVVLVWATLARLQVFISGVLKYCVSFGMWSLFCVVTIVLTSHGGEGCVRTEIYVLIVFVAMCFAAASISVWRSRFSDLRFEKSSNTFRWRKHQVGLPLSNIVKIDRVNYKEHHILHIEIQRALSITMSFYVELTPQLSEDLKSLDWSQCRAYTPYLQLARTSSPRVYQHMLVNLGQFHVD